jgi:hypothetical protein
MAETQIRLGRLFVQEAIKAGTWGAVFLIVVAVFIMAIKQDVKEGIAYGIDRFVSEVVGFATEPALIRKTKQLVKEGIEYTVTKAGQEARQVIEGAKLDTKTQSQPETQEPESRPARQ